MQINTPNDRRRIFFGSQRKPILESKPFIHTHLLTGKEFKTYKTACVYVWMRGNEWLYVGCSYRGLQRVVDSKHHVLHAAEIHDTDRILIMHNLTKQSAQLMEVCLIRKHNPKYNKI